MRKRSGEAKQKTARENTAAATNTSGVTLAQLAKITGHDKGQLCRYARNGMPSTGAGRARRFDIDAVRDWLNKRPRANPCLAFRENRNAAQSVPELNDHERRLLDCLQSPDSPALERTRAGSQLAALAVARGYQDGTLGARMLEDLKRQAEELRKSEQDYIELAQRRGELIELSRAVQVAGALAARLVQATENLERDIARQVEVWIGDSGFNAAGADERSRIVRQTVRQTCHDVRSVEVLAIEAMLTGRE